jgi:2-isopropylmalate synthase
MRYGNTPETDPNIQALVEAGTPAVSIFGKTWLFHVHQALGITDRDNLDLIRQSVAYMAAHDKEVIYDAEHFFDGYKDNPEYALRTLEHAAQAGASALVLCDTNGGTLPHEVAEIVRRGGRALPRKVIGIHAHNDGELAVANTLTAVKTDAGTCRAPSTATASGAAMSISARSSRICSSRWATTASPRSRWKSCRALPLRKRSGQCGCHSTISHSSAAAPSPTKGGIHVSAVMKDPSTYEHISAPRRSATSAACWSPTFRARATSTTNPTNWAST